MLSVTWVSIAERQRAALSISVPFSQGAVERIGRHALIFHSHTRVPVTCPESDSLSVTWAFFPRLSAVCVFPCGLFSLLLLVRWCAMCVYVCTMPRQALPVSGANGPSSSLCLPELRYYLCFPCTVLLQHGADPNIRNTDGKSALDLADPSAKAVLTGEYCNLVFSLFFLSFISVIVFDRLILCLHRFEMEQRCYASVSLR